LWCHVLAQFGWAPGDLPHAEGLRQGAWASTYDEAAPGRTVPDAREQRAWLSSAWLPQAE